MAAKTRAKPERKRLANRQRRTAGKIAVGEASKAKCGAKTGSGAPCTFAAGHGTDHVGTGRCWQHGGKSPTGQLAAARNDLAKPIRVTPGQAIQAAMWSAAGEVAFSTAKVAELTDDKLIVDGAQNVWLRFKHGAEERLVKFAKAAADMGIDLAHLKIAQAQTAMMGRFLEGVLERIDLTPAQRKQVGPAIRAQMAVVASTATEVETTDGRAQRS